MRHYTNTDNPIDFPKSKDINERVKKLVGQALDEAVPYTWDKLDHGEVEKVMKVFAELFVKECCEIAHCNFHVDGLTLGTILKEHFGVEE